jgi:NAD-reducing hydrogenase large subunit
MPRILIDPVTRVEGRASVSIELDAAGRVNDARVHVTELRGLEALVVGRPLAEMPALTSRICGICPVSHSLAAALAGDAVLGARPPPAAVLLRSLLNLAQLVQSHALSFFHLSAPDFVLGHDADPAERSILGLHRAAPGLARDGVALRRFGQLAIEAVAGRRVHPAFAVPGGVARPLAPEARALVLAELPAALAAAERTLEWWRGELPRHAEEAGACGDMESLFLCTVAEGGRLCLDGGRLRVLGPGGALLADGLDPAGYDAVIGEALDPSTRMRLPFYRPMGYPAGLYRVGPLARLNAASRCGTPRADRELTAFRALGRGPVRSQFHAHLARLVELLFALERIADLLDEPAILSPEVRAPPGERREEGVGACEAPRGTLFHHYRVDRDGLVTWANLVVASGQNALAMNRAVLQIARRWLDGQRITPGLLNRVEAGVRAFDPCLSCATHAEGGRAAALELVGPAGEVLDRA